jgi:hypothetical protein
MQLAQQVSVTNQVSSFVCFPHQIIGFWGAGNTMSFLLIPPVSCNMIVTKLTVFNYISLWQNRENSKMNLQAPNTQRQQLSKMPDFFYLESPYSMHAP